ncbi:piggyBac transposable element-derived protein 4-like [Sycon ciliatum]
MDPDSDVEPWSGDDSFDSGDGSDEESLPDLVSIPGSPDDIGVTHGDERDQHDVGDGAASAASGEIESDEDLSCKSHVLATENLSAHDDGSEGIWKKEDNTPLLPQFTGTPGMQVEMPDDATPYEYVRLYFTDAMWSLLVDETNRFARRYIDANLETLAPRALARSWKPVTMSEMKIFLALYLTTGILWKPALDQYWSKDALISTPSFSAAMKRDRFMSILMFLHFSDNAAPDEADKLRKIRRLLDLFIDRFQAVYTPRKTICIDEELVAWKGRLSFRQFIPSKRARFGIKIFALCEDSGYMYNFIVYVGKDNVNLSPDMVKQLGASGAVVAKLMIPLENQGHHLYVDNWYSSLPLAKYLSQHQTGVCGTIRKNRVGLPKRLTGYKQLKKSEYTYRSSQGALVVKLQDTKEVMFLSTLHRANAVPTGKRDREGKAVKKLQVVHDYNRYMGGVDRNDAMLSNYTAARKSTKWYKKLGTHILEEGLLNAFILYQKAGGKRKHYDFIRIAMSELLAEGVKGRHLDAAAPTAAAPTAAAAAPAAAAPTAAAAAAAPAAAEAPAAVPTATASGPAPAEPTEPHPAAATAAAVVEPLPAAAEIAEPAQVCPAAPGRHPDVVAAAPTRTQTHHQSPSRLTGRHHPAFVPPTPKKEKPLKRCVVCWARGRRRESRECCMSCPGQPGLCSVPCFGIYHTEYDYGQI